MPPKVRTRTYGEPSCWTEPCDQCADGCIDYTDGWPQDGKGCDRCDLQICSVCYQRQERQWNWTDCSKQFDRHCPSCVAAAPPHDKETCAACIERDRIVAENRQREAAARKAQRAIKDARRWPTMLETIRGVSHERAAAIATAYPSPARIVDACTAARKRGADDVALLADIPLPSGKRLGRVVAKSVHAALFDDFKA